MSGDTIGMIIVSVLSIWFAIKVLAAVYRAAIKAFKIVGSFAVSFVVALGAVIISNMLFGISTAEAATQVVTTDVVLGAIAMGMFGE